MAAEFSTLPPPDFAAIPERARDAPEAFSADQLEQKPVQAAERMSGLL